MHKGSKFKVCTRCITYNQSPFIIDTLHGFVSQKTSFSVVYTIIDDASTDGESEIIEDFLKSNFRINDSDVAQIEETDDYKMLFSQHKYNENCYFAYYRLKYNHWGSIKTRWKKYNYILRWDQNTDFIALCEGDDFWVSPNKLQKQVDFLEHNIDYSMICCRSKCLSVSRGVYINDASCYSIERIVDKKDIILRGGLFIPTCSIVHRRAIIEHYPDYFTSCHVGDYPLQILCAMKGNVYYLNEPMCVYRVENQSSWVGMNGYKCMSLNRINGIVSEIRMLKGFAKDYPNYRDIFMERLYIYIMNNLPSRRRDKNGNKAYRKALINEISELSLNRRLLFLIRTSPFFWTYPVLSHILV